jgi:hypothetical protein
MDQQYASKQFGTWRVKQAEGGSDI